MNKQPEVTTATRQKIMDAFWSLYKEKPIEKISIQEITKISGNNRATFYRYFTDIYDVLEQIEEELISQIRQQVLEALEDIGLVKKENNGLINFDILYSISAPIMKKHKDKVFILIGKNGDPEFAEKLRGNMFPILIEFSFVSKEMKHLDYLIEFAYSAMMALMTKWYENEYDLTDEEFLYLAQGLTANGVRGFLTK